MAPQPLEPSNRIAPRVNVTLLFSVDDLHRYEFDPVAGCQKRQQNLGFDFKMAGLQIQSGENIQSHQPKTALRIRKHTLGAPGKLAAHPAVHRPAQPGHCFGPVHAIADHERSAFLRAFEKARDIGWRMLPVAIHG